MHKNNYVYSVVCVLVSVLLVSCSAPIVREEIARQPVRLDDFLTEALEGEDPTSVVLNNFNSSEVSADNTFNEIRNTPS